MSTPTKKRGRRKKDATAIVAHELSQIAGGNSSDSTTTIQSNNHADADEINISFGSSSSSSNKKPTAASKKKSEQKIDASAEKRSVSFGGLNITVHSAPLTDIKSVAHSLRFGSQTADNVPETREHRSGSTDRIIHGKVEKKTSLRSTPSRMCEIVEHDSTDDETETKNADDQVLVRSGGTETPQPAPFIWNRPDENTRHVNLSRRIGQVFEQHGQTDLPTTSNIWCWWCCHNFETTPCFMPTFYDDIRKRYIVVGNFCSWPCVKAYNVDQKDMCIHKRNAMLRTMLRRCGVKSEQIKTAPPRSALQTMGGNLNIDDFRKSAGIYEMMKPLSSLTICIEPQTLLKKTQKLLVKR